MGSSLLLSVLAGKIGAAPSGPDAEVNGIAPIEEAGPGQVTFLSNPKYARLARETRASAIIAKEPIPGVSCAYLLTPNPYYAFACAVEQFHPPVRPAPGISPRSFIHPGASLGEGVSVGPFAVVEEGAVLEDRVALLAGVYVGKGARVRDRRCSA